jgi:UDP-N-acetylmuramate dehydrogenase
MMIDFKENFRLKPFNTFGIDAKAKFFVEISNENDVSELIQSEIFKKFNRVILGGGSNMLFTKDFDGLIIHPLIKGIEVIKETSSDVLIKTGCGVVWDDLVLYVVGNNWGGIENLSDIPGNVGASPIQNIGAYGIEVESVIEKVEGFDLTVGKKVEFTHDQCQFGYRNSIFKKHYKNNFLVTQVVLRVQKPPHRLNISYTALAKELENHKEKNICTVREIVKKIRGSKLPETSKLGSAGSFFKNPVVANEVALSITSKYPEAPNFPADEGKVKLSAAWLIDKSGCKGLQNGDAATYNIQPLVIVNLGKAKGDDVWQLSKMIQNKVYKTFGVLLEPEVNIL